MTRRSEHRRAQLNTARERWNTALALTCVVVACVALSLPSVLARRELGPDAVGYVATAHDWLEGRGWVDPVLYSHYLRDASPPLPATAIRPPLLSALLVPPLALGADLDGLRVLHVLWAALTAAAALLVARRVAGLPAAAAFALWIVCSSAWTRQAGALHTEVTAAGALLLVIAAAPRALRGVPGALGLAALVLLASLARPNLLVLHPALLLAALCEHGPRAALRRAPLWAFALAVPVLHLALGRLILALTGLPLYAHYGHMLETLAVSDLMRYRTEYPGAWPFVSAHAGEFAALLAGNLRDTAVALFTHPYYAFVGWLGVPALLWALWRPGRHALVLRALAFAVLGVIASGALSLGGFDVLRYPVPAQLGLALLGACFAARLVARWDAPRALPLLALLPLLAFSDLPRLAGRALADGIAYHERGTLVLASPADHLAAYVAERLPPDGLVAAPDPWRLHLWSGAAALRLPTDLDDLEILHRYLDEQSPAHLVSEGNPPGALLDTSPRLERVLRFARDGGLYRVLDPPPRAFPWTAPRPLATLPDEGPWRPPPTLAQGAPR